MNVLFILGNGFDKTQGLETSYQEFYKDYQKLKATSELEAKLKSSIRSDYETWADLEEGLGAYSNKFSEVNTFREVINIINYRLKDYLINKTTAIDSLGLSKAKLIKDLMYPEGELEPKQKTSFNSYLSQLTIENIKINCETLNYTNTFEVVFGDNEAFLGIRDPEHIPVFFERLLHLHGSLDDMILVGVNDVSQIAKVAFRDDPYLIEEFVKPEINIGCENMKNETFRHLINNADLIILFGVSVGVTDLIWWQTIGERLENKYDTLRIIYYPYDLSKDIIKHQSRKYRWSKDCIAFLKERMNVSKTVEELRERIYVGINKPFLKLT